MNLKRTTSIVLVGAALIAWLAGAATSNHPIPPVTVLHQTTIEKRGAELAIEINRLHERLAPTAAPRTPGRNLFAFRAAARPAASLPPAETPRAALTEFTPAPLALPSLKLSGIAEDPGADGPIRIPSSPAKASCSWSRKARPSRRATALPGSPPTSSSSPT